MICVPSQLIVKKKTSPGFGLQNAKRHLKNKEKTDVRPISYPFNPDLDIIVVNGASSCGVGACILHKITDGTTNPIAHVLRDLLSPDKNYSQEEKEALGIIFAVSKFLSFIHGPYFMRQTDHKPLFTISGSEKGLPTHTANRLQR